MLNLTYGLTLFLHSYVIVLTWETVTLDVKKYVKPYVKKNVKIFRFNIRFNRGVCHLANVPFGECTIWRMNHLANVPFGECTIWLLHKNKKPVFGPITQL
jgi:hypothetical protein